MVHLTLGNESAWAIVNKKKLHLRLSVDEIAQFIF